MGEDGKAGEEGGTGEKTVRLPFASPTPYSALSPAGATKMIYFKFKTVPNLNYEISLCAASVKAEIIKPLPL